MRQAYGVATVALTLLASCAKCGGSSATTGGRADDDDGDRKSSRAPDASASASAAPLATGGVDPLLTDIPEVKDTTEGRATAALRAVLQAYGASVDPAEVARDCKVTEDGASIDDLEDYANAHGLDAHQVVTPREHALVPEAKLLPAITILDGTGDERDFVVLWRVRGDDVEVMDPNEGRVWKPKAEIVPRIALVDVTVPAADWAAAEAGDAYRAALRSRLLARGVSPDAADKKLDVADATARGALDAILRQMETGPAVATSDASDAIDKELACAVANQCDGVTPLPDDLWTAHPAGPGSDDSAGVKVHGAVMLVIVGKRAASP